MFKRDSLNGEREANSTTALKLRLDEAVVDVSIYLINYHLGNLKARFEIKRDANGNIKEISYDNERDLPASEDIRKVLTESNLPRNAQFDDMCKNRRRTMGPQFDFGRKTFIDKNALESMIKQQRKTIGQMAEEIAQASSPAVRRTL